MSLCCVLVPCAAALSSCATQPSDGFALTEIPQPCGVQAAMQPQAASDKWKRGHPPACDLPTAADVAQKCAIHDEVRSADYVPIEEDEYGEPIYDPDRPPTPTYQVQNLSCRFTSERRNQAECSFDLSTPDEADLWQATTVTLEHRFYADHGPTSHIYSVNWWPKRSCRPAAP